jgi:hypothetical protein
MRAFPLPFLAVMCSVIPALPVRATPIIAEFQADNKDTIKDADGDSPDWLEIFNPDPAAVDLTGLSLTDDPLLPQKWVFPAVSLPAKSSLLVWCSGKDRKNPAAELHTNFDLAKEGGYLALVAADGTTKLTEWNLYPEQFEDRSYGTSRPVITQVPLTSGAACRWRVPTAAIPDWETPGFLDTTWTAAATGIGYDTETTYLSLFGAGGTVPTGTISCYVRIPFNLSNAADVLTMTLRMKYDDGFAAFLNGTRLTPSASTNAPAVLVFNSLALTTHNDTDAVVFQSYDVSAQRALLIDGPNVLAIQALNQSSGSSDFLMVPELQVTKIDSAAAAHTGYFATPTPAVNNSAATVAGFVDAPDFSVKRGLFTSPVSVALTTHTLNAQIRYTTNGSAPTATSGTPYTVPITISSSTVLRAGAFVTGWQPSTVKSHTYIFAAQVVNQPAAPAGYPTTWGNAYNFTTGTLSGAVVPADYRMDPGITTNAAYSSLMVPALTTTLPVISLSGDITQIFGTTTGIYANGRLTPGLELATSMEFWVPGGKENWQENVGLRIHGGDAPLEHPKKPFRVYFRKEYGAGRLQQPLFAGSPVESFDKLQLRPGGHDGWSVPFGSGNESLARHAVYCRDRFLRQTELDMGRLGVRGRYAHLYINGLYWGFYDLHEVPSQEFYADHEGGADEDWDVVEHSNTAVPLFNVVDGSGSAMDAALALVRPASNAANQSVYDQLQTYINYDELIDHLIVQMWGAQNDWLGPVFRGTPGVNLTDGTRFFNKNWEAGRRSRGANPTDFLFQVWDAEISMGNSLSNLVTTMRVSDFNHTLVGTPDTDTSDTGNTSRTSGTPGPHGEIYYALRKYNPRFRIKVADRLQKNFFNDGVMTVARNQTRLQAFRDELDLPIVAESARWGDVNSGNPIVVTFNRNDHWRSEMDWLKNTYIPGRNATLLNQFRALGMWPTTLAPVYSLFGGSVSSGYQLSITDPNAAGGTIYYTFDGSDPMTPPGASGNITLLGPGTVCRYKVPSFAYPANSWKGLLPPWNNGGDPNLPGPGGLTPAQEEATWSTGPQGLGFDANPTFGPHITTAVTGMQGTRAALYIRIPFTVTAEQKAAMTSLTLNLKYDDGAYVFLNGSAPLLRPNAGNVTPSYIDTATAARADTDAVNYQSFDLSPQIANLIVGSENVLAIQGLNITAADDDFLCVAQLVGTTNTAQPPSPAAIAYSGPVTLPQSGPVKARILKSGIWSPLTDASFIVGVPGGPGNVTISEFSYNPVASPEEITAGFTSQQFEFVELMNISAGPVDMTGCRFDDGISFDFPVNSIIAPGQRILLVANQAAFLSRHPGATIFGVFANESNLSNSGERLELMDAAGGHIFDFTYDDKSPWPEAADGGGFSLVLINPTLAPDPAIPSNWRASVSAGGTPGWADGDTFAAWAGRNGVTGQMADDSNANGLTNLAEYGLGLTPSSADTNGFISAGFEEITVSGATDTYLVIHYRRNYAADDVTITPEMSTDLLTWTALTNEVSPPVTNPNGTEDTVRRSPMPVTGGDRVFVRVSVVTR